MLIAAGSYYVGQYRQAPHRSSSTNPDSPVVSDGSASSDLSDLSSLIRSRQSGVVVDSAGTVVKVLPDDVEGDRHQRFLVRIPSGQTMLIAHNIDLAPRAPVSAGDSVRFKGEFEYNDRGGVVHWTHHDPRRRHPDGWIEANGRRYD
jgi:hypothetical protein